MKLYLDTADRAAAESLMATGLFTGVTTNPTILQRASKGVADVGDIYDWAIEAGAREVFFQAWGEDPATLIERGRRLRELGPAVVVKFVATRAGATACAALAAEGAPTLLTAIYDPGQAIVAAAAGATYIAPYLGRLNDAGRDGIAEVLAMHEVLAGTGSATKILLASIRNVPRHGCSGPQRRRLLHDGPVRRGSVLHRSDDRRGGTNLRGRGPRDLGMTAGSVPAVVVAGDALVDLTPATTVSGTTAYERHPGGSCLNVAVGLGRLDVPTGFLARVSTDAFGQLIRTHLAASGVEPTGSPSTTTTWHWTR